MIGKITKNIVCYITKGNHFTKEQSEEMEYTLKVLLYEIIKIIFEVLLFYIIGYSEEVIMIILVMVFIKPFIGGYHESTQFRCFIATVIIELFIIILAITNQLNFISKLILGVINIFCIYHRAPIINDKMPMKKEESIKRNRKIGITNVFILTSLAIIFFNDRLSSVIMWTITVLTMLMFNKK
ncbi:MULTISPECIES: accessory gene regulator B family protein [Clostridium]|uniref:accessory gene regulator B family protein n=1 Tax=Clostridium TaxID=1485 RepID=UPI000DD0732A|nr:MULTISPECIES: accessory gene regulator B family protein [Clostridium]MBS7129878.1 accessory gene regulator B family protein [Clostridium sp.]MDB2076106.1 accessory gene regulator B family protein [Clostridium paraputrificum]MDB2079436.1 accessory gene regulator B family protein [Clostridium paraputrificum]MDB2084361.1 accessory gene regulator B family protein [Clostridium paraputrificum]MDB2098897.1 accessory gene regulator B family protein [Clostridium paraputrificum]